MLKEKTQELIQACKDAGYKHLAIFCTDENVPESVRIKKSRSGYWMGGGPGSNCPSQPHLVCASPPQRGTSPKLPGDKWPKMWGIVKKLKLNFSGAGYGDCFPVNPALFADLDVGYYDLSK